MSNLDVFRDLHVPGRPLVLWNIWDAGSARAVAEAGAPALATGSLSVAGAQGYPDGEAIPLHLLLTLVRRIAASVELPLSVDFEGGFADDPGALAENAARLAETGAVGINFEDGRLRGQGLWDVDAQAHRVAAVCRAGLFVNARTDLFLKHPPEMHDAHLPEAVARAAAYAEAGAQGFFAPGLVEPALIGRLCEAVALPVNVMKSPVAPDLPTLASLGVARVSFGPYPWRAAMAALAQAFRADTGTAAPRA